MKTSQCIGRRVMLSAIVWLLAYAVIGCKYFPESTFNLATDSRLPKWVKLPPGLKRADVSMTMSYYIKPWGSSATFVLHDIKQQVITSTDGKVKCQEPFQLKTYPEGSGSEYPSYEAATVNGVTEIIEHKKMEPVFYIVDDPAVWKQYLAIGCG